MTTPDAFTTRLEVFNNEQVHLQQYLFTALGVRRLAIDRPEVLHLMNSSMFWRVAHQAAIEATFITMGRVFDEDSKHNIGRIRKVIDKTPQVFAIEGLRKRKALLPGVDADDYVKDRHALEPSRAQAILYGIDYWQDVYSSRYKGVRHSFAHKKSGDIARINALLAKTNIEEMVRMSVFLHALWRALDKLYLNGGDPIIWQQAFILPPAPLPDKYKPGELAYRDAQAAILAAI